MSALVVVLVLALVLFWVWGLVLSLFLSCLMLLAFVFVSAFVLADLMALLCFFRGSVIALWLGGSRLLCFCLLGMHSFIFIEHAKLGS